jgi:hypothetical protein
MSNGPGVRCSVVIGSVSINSQIVSVYELSLGCTWSSSKSRKDHIVKGEILVDRLENRPNAAPDLILTEFYAEVQHYMVFNQHMFALCRILNTTRINLGTNSKPVFLRQIKNTPGKLAIYHIDSLRASMGMVVNEGRKFLIDRN